jgi:hypothetical protein
MRAFPRPGADLSRRHASNYLDEKMNLVKGCAGIESIRDFGGLYIVFGKYLLEPAVHLRCRLASMVDVTPREEWEQAKQEARAQNPQLEVEFVNADFREPSLYPRLTEVDASILFEVLLHQENYVEVIKNVVSRTRKYICVSQPCLREEFFTLPSAAVLLQFYPQALKQLLRANSFWPEEPVVDTFQTWCWMWGHTTSHLIATFRGFGWDLDFGEVIDNCAGDFWEFPMLRFRKR